jgi:hypothetical protein
MCDDQRISFICNSICAIGRVEENQRKFESFIEKSYEAKQFLNDTRFAIYFNSLIINLLFL